MAKIIDEWSLRAVPLQMRCCGHVIGRATGFFWLFDGRAFLITNWHVLSGRDPKNMICKDRDGAVPDELAYPRFIRNESYDDVVYSNVGLIDTDGNNLWLEHPVHGSNVDVAAVPVPLAEEHKTVKGPRDTYIHTVAPNGGFIGAELFNGLPPWNGSRREMGDDLFVLGFPLGLMPTGHFPLWKRASVASEMDIFLEGRPSFLIDTATREGMSGSPVVHIDRSGPITYSGEFNPGRNISFVGIYSGRHIGDSEIEAQLGVVWREELIREIVACNQLAVIDLSRLSKRALG